MKSIAIIAVLIAGLAATAWWKVGASQHDTAAQARQAAGKPSSPENGPAGGNAAPNSPAADSPAIAQPAHVSSQRTVLALEGSPRRGSASPLVTIVEFGDFTSPTAQQLAPVLQGLIARHPQEIAHVWKDNPATSYRPRSGTLARFGRAVFDQKGDEGFWKAHDELFRDLSQTSDADLERIGQELGVAVRPILSTQQEELTAQVEQSLAEARSHGVTSSPTLFINGRRVQGRPEPGQIAALIEQELTASRKHATSAKSEQE